MSSITAQQTKLDLVPKENRFDIRKCNGRIPRGLTSREPTFQVVLDDIALTPCYPAFLITTDVPEGRDFDALPSEEDIVHFLRELGHTRENNSLNDFVVDQMHQPWRTFDALINRGLSGKTSGAVSPKIARKFKKASPSKKDSSLVPIDNEPAKKEILCDCLNICNWPIVKVVYEIMSSITAQQTKLDLELVPKENRFDIRKCNGRIPRGLTQREPTFQVVLDDIALTPCYPAFPITTDVPEICPRVQGRDFDALPSEEDIVHFLRELGHTRENNSLNDFVVDQMHQPWRTFDALINRGLSGKTSGLNKLRVVSPKIARKFKKASPSKKDSSLVPIDDEPAKKEDDTTKSESKCRGNDEDDNNDDNDSENEGNDKENKSDDDKTPSDNANLESKNDDKSEGDEDRGMDDTTNQFSDDVQDKDADVEMTVAQQEKGSFEITQEQVVEDAHVTILNVAKEAEMFMSIMKYQESIHPLFLLYRSRLSLKHHLVIALEKDVVELKKDPLHTQVIALVNDHLETRMGATREEFMNFLSASVTDRITEQVRNLLPQILLEEVSNFALPATATLTEFELKKILIDKLNTSESYLTALEHREYYDGLINSYHLDKDFFSSYDVYSLKRSQKDKDKDEGPSAGSDRGFKKRKT
nr:hypothetical protein [Tanacetum cinerariifolium]